VAFIDDVCTAVSGQVVSMAGPQVFRLDVGLPDTAPLDTLHDLDNYLFPLVPKLAQRTGRELASVWASKRHAPTSKVGVGAAVATDDPRGTYAFEVTTTASASTSLYKEQIRDQLATTSPLPGSRRRAAARVRRRTASGLAEPVEADYRRAGRDPRPRPRRRRV
jgi:hypothetical protein